MRNLPVTWQEGASLLGTVTRKRGAAGRLLCCNSRHCAERVRATPKDMQAPQALPAEVEHLNRLVDLLRDRAPNEFEVRSIENGLKRLIEQGKARDMAAAYTGLSMAKMLRADTAAAVAAARNAVRLAPYDTALKTNLLTTFLNVGENDAASEFADRCYEGAKGHARLLTAIASTYVSTYRPEDAIRTIDELSKIADHVPGAPRKLGTKSIQASIERRANFGYSGAQLRELFNAAVIALRDFDGVGPLRYTSVTTDDGLVVHHFHLLQSAEVCAEYDWRLVDRLVESFERLGEEVVTFSCLPLSAYFDLNEDVLARAPA